MELLEAILEILLFPLILLLIILPVALPLLLYRFLKKRGYARTWQLLALTPLLVLGYLVYISVYPGPTFYRQDFREVTGITLPEEADFEYTSASSQDLHGDYASVSLIQVEREFYTSLQEHLVRRGMQPTQQPIGSAELDGALGQLGDRTLVKGLAKQQEVDAYYYVGFLSDWETIIVHRLSW